MIKINVEAQAAYDAMFPSPCSINCEIVIPEDATLEEALYAFLKAAEIGGYSHSVIEEYSKLFDK